MTILEGVRITSVAHGGHMVARHEGRVIFVRHAIPGEIVDVEITDDSRASYWRGDAIAVREASPHRVEPPCPIAGRCGGCDFQHISLEHQRDLKTVVVAEQLSRLAGLAWSGQVEPAPGEQDGLGWRTRVRFSAAADGRLGMRAHRSHTIVPLPEQGCAIASERTHEPAVLARFGGAGSEVLSVGAARGRAVLAGTVKPGRPARLTLVDGPARVGEEALGRSWQVPAAGFWQVHPAAADLLVSVVMDGLAPQFGETAFDLYCGVGLFAGALADAGCHPWGIEASAEAIEAAKLNVPDSRFFAGRVEPTCPDVGSWRGRVTPTPARLPAEADVVVLDPPRQGAGRGVVEAVVSRAPRAIAYVACDPAALARDLALFQGRGYAATQIRALDLFPMTHHVESVAVLERG